MFTLRCQKQTNRCQAFRDSTLFCKSCASWYSCAHPSNIQHAINFNRSIKNYVYAKLKSDIPFQSWPQSTFTFEL